MGNLVEKSLEDGSAQASSQFTDFVDLNNTIDALSVAMRQASSEPRRLLILDRVLDMMEGYFRSGPERIMFGRTLNRRVERIRPALKRRMQAIENQERVAEEREAFALPGLNGGIAASFEKAQASFAEFGKMFTALVKEASLQIASTAKEVMPDVSSGYEAHVEATTRKICESMGVPRRIFEVQPSIFEALPPKQIQALMSFPAVRAIENRYVIVVCEGELDPVSRRSLEEIAGAARLSEMGRLFLIGGTHADRVISVLWSEHQRTAAPLTGQCRVCYTMLEYAQHRKDMGLNNPPGWPARAEVEVKSQLSAVKREVDEFAQSQQRIVKIKQTPAICRVTLDEVRAGTADPNAAARNAGDKLQADVSAAIVNGPTDGAAGGAAPAGESWRDRPALLLATILPTESSSPSASVASAG